MNRSDTSYATPYARVLLLALSLGACHFADATPLDDGKAAIERGKASEALRLLLPLANAGDSEAQRLVGEVAYAGTGGVKRDLVAAFRWNELAAAAGNRIAQYNLGYLYEHGEGVDASKTSAEEWYRKAAMENYAPAQHRLADLYAGTGKRDEAIYWYDKARQLGDEAAKSKYTTLEGARAEEIADAKHRAYLEDEQEKEEERQKRQARADEQRRQQEEVANDGPSAAEIIMGQVQKNAAEARTMIRTVNRETATANAQIARASEQKRAQDRSQNDSRTGSSSSSRTTSTDRVDRSNAGSASTSDSDGLALTASSKTWTAPEPASRPATERRYSAEPDPYDKEPFKWNKVTSAIGVHATRDAACGEVKDMLAKEKAKMAGVANIHTVTPCVCAVNEGYQPSLAVYKEWSVDRYSCRLYYQSTQLVKGTISK